MADHVHDLDEHDHHDGLPPPPAAGPWELPRWLAITWIAGGAVGIVASLVGGIVGVAFIGNATDTSVQALELTDTVLAGVEDTATVLDTTFTDVAETLTTVQGSVTDASDAMGQVGTTLDDLTVLVTEDVPDSLDAVNAAMPQLIQTAGVIDSTFNALSFLGVNYSPDTPLDESLVAVQDQLSNIPPDLRSQREGLDDVAVRLDDLAAQGDDIATDLDTITTDLETSRDLIQEYRTTATDAGALVDDLSGRLVSRSRVARTILALLAVTVAIGQTVPLLLGLQALRAIRRREDLDDHDGTSPSHAPAPA